MNNSASTTSDESIAQQARISTLDVKQMSLSEVKALTPEEIGWLSEGQIKDLDSVFASILIPILCMIKDIIIHKTSQQSPQSRATRIRQWLK